MTEGASSDFPKFESHPGPLSNNFEAIIADLQSEKIKDQLNGLCVRMWQADGGAIYPVDLLANAVIKRCMQFCYGFALLTQSKLYLSAAPFVRMQLDNALRFYALFLVEKPHDLAEKILKGVELRKLKDRHGCLMTDAYLVEKLMLEHPSYEWMKRVYSRTSGFIHLSNAHIFSTFSRETQDHKVEFRIGLGDEHIEPKIWLELAQAFVATTDSVIHYVHGWVVTKEMRAKER